MLDTTDPDPLLKLPPLSSDWANPGQTAQICSWNSFELALSVALKVLGPVGLWVREWLWKVWIINLEFCVNSHLPSYPLFKPEK